MASNRSSKTRTENYERELGTTELREQTRSRSTTPDQASHDPVVAPSADDAAERSAQQAAILEQRAVAERNVRMARSPGAMGPLGRNALLIAAVTLVALIGIWALLAI